MKFGLKFEVDTEARESEGHVSYSVSWPDLGLAKRWRSVVHHVDQELPHWFHSVCASLRSWRMFGLDPRRVARDARAYSDHQHRHRRHRGNPPREIW